MAREAGVALCLVNYYHDDKTSLIRAAPHLHLGPLAQADEGYAEINAAAFDRYLDGVAALISNAKPELSWGECRERSADIIVIQNGMWLTSPLGVDNASVQRSITRTEDIAFAPSRNSISGDTAFKEL